MGPQCCANDTLYWGPVAKRARHGTTRGAMSTSAHGASTARASPSGSSAHRAATGIMPVGGLSRVGHPRAQLQQVSRLSSVCLRLHSCHGRRACPMPRASTVRAWSERVRVGHPRAQLLRVSCLSSVCLRMHNWNG